jgi:hypothetical protein
MTVVQDYAQQSDAATTTSDSSAIRRQALLLGVGALVGIVVVLNQLGSVISRLAPIAVLSPIWEVNSLIEPIGLNLTAAALVVFALVCYSVLAANAQLQAAYRDGILAGCFLLPLVILAVAVIAGAGWVIVQVLRLIGVVLMTMLDWILPVLVAIAMPFTWVFEHILTPIANLIAMPFRWLWKTVISVVLGVVVWPFAWLAKNLLAPLFGVLVKYVFKPIFFLIAAIFGGVVVLAPFSAIGNVLFRGFQTAVTSPLTPQAVFDQGVGVGFLCFDALAMVILKAVRPVPVTPSLFLLVSVAMPALFFIRVAQSRAYWWRLGWASSTFPEKAKGYWKTSKLEAISFCVVIPLAVCLYILAQSQSHDQS